MAFTFMELVERFRRHVGDFAYKHSILNLSGFPGGTTTFLRADGSFTTPGAAGGTLVSRYLNSASINLNVSAAGYTDFGGSFTTGVTTLAGDKVCIRVQSGLYKNTSGYASIVVDRGGTKLPGATSSTSVFADAGGSNSKMLPFMYEFWDTPGAGTFTYKPQLYDNDTGTAVVGAGTYAHFVVEVWR